MNAENAAAIAASQKDAHKRIKLLITIVDRGVGKKVVELCRARQITYNLSFLGTGTASSEILNFLGLGETQKDVIFSVVLEEKLPEIMGDFSSNLKLDSPGGGIAFTVPIMSVGGPVTLQYISGLLSALNLYQNTSFTKLSEPDV